MTFTCFPIKQREVSRQKELHIHIGVALTGPPTPLALQGAAAIRAAFASQPLAWVISCHPLLEKITEETSSLIEAVTARLKTPGDTLLSAGYSGAPLPLLTLGEMTKELVWSVKNPWGSGIADVFPQKPTCIVPPVADFNRDKAQALYDRAGFPLIGRPAPAASAGFWGPALGDKTMVFNYHPFSRFTGLKPTHVIGTLFPRDRSEVFILLDPARSEQAPLLLEVIATLTSRRGARITPPFQGEARPSAQAADPPPQRDTPAAVEEADRPLARFLREKAARLRARGALKNSDLREVLLLTAAGEVETEKARRSLKTRPPIREGTAYTANMPGEILLPGEDFDAHFQAGRLTALRTGSTNYLPHHHCRGYVVRHGREQELSFDRIFSFEKNELRGLETFLLFPGRRREHFFTLRYAFAGDLPWLIISGETRREITAARDGVEILAPLEIPLGEYEAEERPLIRSIYPDGSTSLTELSVDRGAVRIAGMVFSLPSRDKQLVFGFVTHHSKPIHLLSIRAVREKKKWTAWLNPFGAYGSLSARAGLAVGEVRTFYLGVRNNLPPAPPQLPASVLKTVPAHQLFIPEQADGQP